MKKIALVSLLLIFICISLAHAQQNINLFLGTMTSDSQRGIYSCQLNLQTGELSDLRRETTLREPSFLSLSKDNAKLYTFARTSGKSQVYTLKVGSDLRKLSVIDSTVSDAAAFCYVAADAQNKYVLCASYGDGLVSSFEIDPAGRFTGNNSTITHTPNTHDLAVAPTTGELKPRAHIIRQEPQTGYFYVADLGLDKMIIYELKDKALVALKEVKTAKGAGPRHMDFHPNGKFMALINELDKTINIYKRDSDGIFSLHVQTMNIVPDGFKGEASGADIHYSPDGRFLYASTRGFNSVVSMDVDQTTGVVYLKNWTTKDLNWPRNFAIDPTGKYLLVANQYGNSVVSFAINPENGLLTPTNFKVDIAAPVCVLFCN